RSASFYRAWRPQGQSGVDGITNKLFVLSLTAVKTACSWRGIVPLRTSHGRGRMTVIIGRRALLAALGGPAAWPLAGRAQQPTMPVVGLVTNHLWLTSSAAAWLLFSTAGSHPAALAAKAATTTIPIVFSVANDPVPLGLVVSLARARKRTSAACYIGHKQSSARLRLAPIQRRAIP